MRRGVGLLVVGLACLALSLPALPPDIAAQDEPTGPPTPLPLFALPTSQRAPVLMSSTLALGEDGRTVVSANLLSDSASISVPSEGRTVAEIAVGRDPRSVAITPDGTRALVANRLDDTISVINLNAFQVVSTIRVGAGGAAWPVAVVAQNDLAYVALEGASAVAIVDIEAEAVISLIAVPDAPAGLALWGEFLYVTHFWSGDLSLIYLPQRRLISTTPTATDAALAPSIALDVTRGLAYVPSTRLNVQQSALTYDSAALPVVGIIDLNNLTAQPREQLVLTLADQPVNMPFAAALDRFANRLYVANAGTNSVSVLDLNTGTARAHLETGANPRGVLLSRDNLLLYVHNVLENTISVFNTSSFERVAVAAVADLTLPFDVLIGAQLFHSAIPPMSANTLSCATCHFDGMSDGRVWQIEGETRNTPLLYALPESPPYTWTGAWDEVADTDLKIRFLMGGTGLIPNLPPDDSPDDPHTGLSPELDALVNYLNRLTPPRNANPPNAALAARGQDVFLTQGCGNCHIGAAYTNLERYDVGTGGTFDTPSLRWLFASAPYLHDGSAPTLRDVFEREGIHQLTMTVAPEDVEALTAFLLTLPEG